MSTGKRARWREFLTATKDNAARPNLLRALSYFENQDMLPQIKTAVDLGCGAGADTIELIKNGWQVLAIDKEQEAITLLESKVGVLKDHVQTKAIPFENIKKLPKSLFVNSSLSLPFCNPHHFDGLWKIIKDSILTTGRFSGDFFGNRDEWSANPNMTFHTSEQIKKLFSKFRIEYIYERDEKGPTATAGIKHWHSFTVIARKL
jgi:SAM-dependent methyltransferase